jgi:hypothetical protein
MGALAHALGRIQGATDFTGVAYIVLGPIIGYVSFLGLFGAWVKSNPVALPFLSFVYLASYFLFGYYFYRDRWMYWLPVFIAISLAGLIKMPRIYEAMMGI